MSDGSANDNPDRSTSSPSPDCSARDSARRLRPCVVRSSSPVMTRRGGSGWKETMGDPIPVRGRRSRAAPTLARMATVDDVEAALANVIDPELGLDFVELGLIYGIEVEGPDVHVTFSLTTPACPIGPQVSEQIEEFVGELEGVGQVTSSMTFTPPWSPDRMSEDAKFALGY